MKLRNSIPKLMNPCELKGILSHVMIKLTTQSNRTLKVNNYLMKLKRLQMGLKRVLECVIKCGKQEFAIFYFCKDNEI